MPIDCLLIDDPPQIGPWNMAVDEAMLEWSAATGRAALRLYRWAEPTLSLGYFQPYDTRTSHAASRDCTTVRRLTGGGAILHDRELTYSLAIPSAHPLTARREALYEAVHGAMVETLAGWGVSASLCDGAAARPPAAEPFLCFLRRAPGDVLAGSGAGPKVAGSAQRRRRGAVLQHGSVLLGRSAFAPELPGLAEIAGRPVEAGALAAAWLKVLTPRLGCRWVAGPLADDVRRRAETLVQTRYAAAAWTKRCSRPSRF